MTIKELKDYLKITWDHEDLTLSKTIDRGKSNLEDLTGTKLEFDKEGQAKSLLLDYCRYAYNNSLEYFEDNFSKEILRMQLKEAVKANVK